MAEVFGQRGAPERRCVIYVRKSVEEGLEQEYNSLDAQEDACRAYIQSQQFNGWRFTGRVYSDGGFSGGTMDRPALKELLADLAAGAFDIVAVYKIDRLSRSLCDFTNMSRTFEAHGASFVSVTQNIDTSNAMGKMILNVLMSFAQFEREVTAERVRDKSIATRMKGMWNGGPAPYGYEARDKRLVPKEPEAGAVREAFRLYDGGSTVNAIAEELTRRGLPGGRNGEWTVQKVANILDSRYYVGEFPCRDQWVPGQQKALVGRELFDRVAARRAERRKGRAAGTDGRRQIEAPLRGLVRCGHCGGAMCATYTEKAGARYYYYSCSRDMKRGRASCPVPRLSAALAEKAVFGEVGRILNSGHFAGLVSGGDESRRRAAARVLGNVPGFWASLFPAERTRLLRLLVRGITVHEDRLSVVLDTGGVASLVAELTGSGAADCGGGCVTVDVPVGRARHSGRAGLVSGGWADAGDDGARRGLLSTLASGFRFLGMLRRGEVSGAKDIESMGICGRKVAERAMHVAGLSPVVVHRILTGELPDVTVDRLLQIRTPVWAEQHEALGIKD